MRYCVVYNGIFFVGDDEEWNGYETMSWADAYDLYLILKETGIKAYIKDNDYDVCFEDDEWY